MSNNKELQEAFMGSGSELAPLQLSHLLPLWDVHRVDDCFGFLLCLLHLLQHLRNYKIPNFRCSVLSSVMTHLSIIVTNTQSSYPPFLPGFGLSDSFDRPCVDLFPLFFVFLHHLPGHRHWLLPVFLFILQEPLGYLPRLLWAGKPAGDSNSCLTAHTSPILNLKICYNHC